MNKDSQTKSQLKPPNLADQSEDQKLTDDQAEVTIVSVLLPIPAQEPYSYKAPKLWNLKRGDIVRVPLGPRKVAGVIWQSNNNPNIDPKKLRYVAHKFNCPQLNEPILQFVEWLAKYTLSPPGMVMKMVLRVPAAFDPEPCVPGIIWKGRLPDKMTSARQKVIAMLKQQSSNEHINIAQKQVASSMAWTRIGLAKASGVSISVIDGLIKQGLFEDMEIPPLPITATPNPEYDAPELSDHQSDAAQKLRDCVHANTFNVHLIDGVTGSGKTEIYFEAVAAALKQGKQVLILLPEIALTQIFLERFEKRFGAEPAPWHSDISPRQRERIWRQVASGEIQVVAGARSALFLPFNNLGLIIVDEEHDIAYKQEDRVFYNARDMAVVRGSIGQHAVILASATPSIESLVNAEQGRYTKTILKTRHSNAVMPVLKAIDMRKAKPAPGDFISPALLEAIEQTTQRGEQSLLFLNRRGYAPLTLCRACGHRFECNNCSAWLVEHRFRGTLNCHHCGHHEQKPEACPNCGTLDYLVPCGPGVERLAEEIESHFPQARTIILSSDLMGGAARLRLEFEAIANGEADIIIGTQLVAKGHNFPLMTLVGVIDADLGLAGGDPRASERTFQMLTQVTGRAGRYGRKSLGLLQSYNPDHPVIASIVSGDRDQFYEQEIRNRQLGTLPPFGRLASIIISAHSKIEAENHARSIARAANRAPMANMDVSLLGPAEAPLAMLRGRHRFRLLAHCSKTQDLQSYLRNLLNAAPKTKGSVRLSIDIDPQSFI